MDPVGIQLYIENGKEILKEFSENNEKYIKLNSNGLLELTNDKKERLSLYRIAQILHEIGPEIISDASKVDVKDSKNIKKMSELINSMKILKDKYEDARNKSPLLTKIRDLFTFFGFKTAFTNFESTVNKAEDALKRARASDFVKECKTTLNTEPKLQDDGSYLLTVNDIEYEVIIEMTNNIFRNASTQTSTTSDVGITTFIKQIKNDAKNTQILMRTESFELRCRNLGIKFSKEEEEVFTHQYVIELNDIKYTIIFSEDKISSLSSLGMGNEFSTNDELFEYLKK